MNNGIFIVFEGIDGCGKDTQINLLSEEFKKRNISHRIDREPTDSPIGKLIRNEYLTNKDSTDDYDLRLLFVADCYHHIHCKGGIIDTIKSGTSILCSRFQYSNMAYGAVKLGLPKAVALNECTIRCVPDLTFILDVSADTAMERINIRNKDLEMFEKANILEKVFNNYHNLPGRLFPHESFIFINANRSIEDVHKDICYYTFKYIDKKEKANEDH